MITRAAALIIIHRDTNTPKQLGLSATVASKAYLTVSRVAGKKQMNFLTRTAGAIAFFPAKEIEFQTEHGRGKGRAARDGQGRSFRDEQKYVDKRLSGCIKKWKKILIIAEHIRIWGG